MTIHTPKDRFLEELKKMKERKTERILNEIEWWGEGIPIKQWPTLHNIEEDLIIAYNVYHEKHSIQVDKRGKRYTHPNRFQRMKESLGIMTGKTARYNLQRVAEEKAKFYTDNWIRRILFSPGPITVKEMERYALKQINHNYQVEVWNYLQHKAQNKAIRDKIAAKLKQIEDHDTRREKHHKMRIPIKAEWQHLAQLAEEELAFRKLCLAANRETRNKIGKKLKKVPQAERRLAYYAQHIPYKRKACDLVYWKQMVERVRQD